MRFTERFLLPFTGPADVADARRATEPTEEQRARGAQLEREFRRAPGPGGRSYLVIDDAATDASPLQQPPVRSD
ncbi:hypothetical protein [Actinotalea soli]|nr:hypothetical protein [Actinotalea soli]